MMKQRLRRSVTGFLAAGLLACTAATQDGSKPQDTDANETVDYSPKPYIQVNHPEWLKDAVIYQVNTRQYSQAGTFKAIQDDLPRLKELGVDILWFMPIHPIGEVKRKGSLGSPYSIKDYRGVNPEHGTLEDFKALVDAAHADGFKVILDWVANHSSWDNPLVTDHPDWFTRDANGEMQAPPWTDWDDVVDLNYDNAEMRQYMTESMLFWVREVGVDGFRCDVAGFVPLDFWETTRAELDKIKPVFMLAEWNFTDLHRKAFDATYGWPWKEAMQAIVNDGANAGRVSSYYGDMENIWPENAIRLLYTSNHDQNSWDGRPQDIYGDAYEAMIALSYVSEGIPMVYNGQEAGSENRLEFFDKDPIVWKQDPKFDLFKSLIALKTDNPALWNGKWGGRTQIIKTTNPDQVFSFKREKAGNRMLAIFNLSSEEQVVALTGPGGVGNYEEFGSADPAVIDNEQMTLPPWGYRILTSNE